MSTMYRKIRFVRRLQAAMESESGTTNTKISDSGYSNSCSNSNSQRSASSKSRHSGSNSSRSSGYCGTAHVDGSNTSEATSKRNKDKDHKKKKLKLTSSTITANIGNAATVTSTTSQNVDSRTISAPPKETVSSESISGTDLQPPTNVEPLIVTTDTVDTNKDQIEDTLKQDVLHTAESPPAGDVLPPWNEDQSHRDCQAENGDITMEVTNVSYQPVVDTTNKISRQPDDGFCCVISMYDGVVLYTTPSLTSVLGFPKDMWLGRSFIDFVHPKDRETFSSHITTGIALPLVDSKGKYKDVRHTLYVCLRKYRGLKTSGYGVIEKAVSYEAFQLTVIFRHITESIESKLIDGNGGMFLVVVAVPVYSAYRDETRKSAKFGMRHTAACIFSHVDPDVVTNFGFLPQDMLGKSVFDFYHPEDMPFLKEVYESVMEMCQIAGSVFRSKPYRFAVQNGGFAMIETEWSSFVNPWSRRLEFVIGLHRVLQGPTNPNIFEPPKDDELRYLSEEVVKESKLIQEEILSLLSAELTRPCEAVKQEVSKRCKDLATFMESLMDEVSTPNLQLDLPQDPDPTISERDSVMLGEISPHHDYYDSKSSSETPPSYNQLNYNENIQRFFQSKPKTTVSDESGERPGPLQSANDTDNELKSLSAVQDCSNNQKCMSPVQNSGDSGSGSAENFSSGSNPNIEIGTSSATHTSNGSYKPPHLTEALLQRHNEDMEKIMIKRHRDQRTSVKLDRDNKKCHHKEKMSPEKHYDKCDGQGTSHCHGLKRSGSHSWEGDSHKVSKYKHQPGHINNECNEKIINCQNMMSSNNQKTNPNANAYHSKDHLCPTGMNDVNLWPPFSVAMTSMNSTQPCGVSCAPTTPGGNFTTGMFPVYYIPTQQRPTIPGEFSDPNISARFQVQYMPGMLYNYNTIFPASPIFCSPLPMVPLAVPPSIPLHQESMYDPPSINPLSTDRKPSPSLGTVSQFQRPASQATSVKAEPGSAMGSIASASIVNKAMSECSRKELGLQSVCSPDSPLVSPPDGETDMEHFNLNSKNNDSTDIKCVDNNQYRNSHVLDEESSYSSFYSSFLKTDAGSGSNDESTNIETKDKSDDNSWQKPIHRLRKREPPWLETVSVTPELVYRYQMSVKGLEDILEADLNSLKEIHQPMLVNDQLNQLYIEMELEGLSTKLTLEEGITSSSSSSDENTGHTSKPKKKRRSYSSLMMIYEENAPFPPP